MPVYGQVVLRVLLVAVLGLAPAGFLAAQDEDDEFPQYRPGLVAEFAQPGGQPFARIDEQISFVWGKSAADPRLSNGPFTAVWRGRLFSIEPGAYRLHVFAAGKVSLTLEGQPLLDVDSKKPGWHAADEIKLTYGYHPLEIRYQPRSDDARLSLFWEGPKFALEPVPERHLFHDPKVTIDESFERGQRLVRALRCQACHELGTGQADLAAPALTHLGDTTAKSWLVEWLSQSAAVVDKNTSQADSRGAETPDNAAATAVDRLPRRMPHFALAKSDAEAIAAYLLAESAPTTLAPQPAGSGDASAGEKLFRTVGCLACHRAGELGQLSLFGGGDLSQVAEKRSPQFFAQWLSEPAKLNPSHRMPVFKLSSQETADLAAYLATLKRDDHAAAAVSRDTKSSGDEIAKGKRLVAEHRCASCHKLPASSEPNTMPVSRLSATSDWPHSCLTNSAAKAKQPRFALSQEQAAAIRTYVAGLPQQSKHSKPPLDGKFVLEERNCLGCHARGLTAGIADRLAPLVAAHSELAQELPLLTPPALMGVGDKMHEQALVDAITTRHPPRRPWLAIRMPRFELRDDEQRAIVQHFIDSDRIPDRPATKTASKSVGTKEFKASGGRLVTSDGFGCTSCHAIGDWTPKKVALNARGTDLSDLGKRLRKPWFDRWVRNPARIVPRMEMPSIVAPVRSILHEDLQQQLAAVWTVLNEPGFNPPAPSAIRIVRTSNVKQLHEPATVLTDVLEVDKQILIRPLIVALPNRHTLLVDLENNRLAGWWTGDALTQRTRGKSWYWEPAGTPLVAVDTSATDLALLIGGRTIAPQRVGQFFTEFDWLEHAEGGLRFGHRLRFAPPDSKNSGIMLHIEQTFTPRFASSGPGSAEPSGFQRRIVVRGLPEGVSLVFNALPGMKFTTSDNGRTLVRADLPGNCRVTLAGGSNARFGKTAELNLSAKGNEPVAIGLEYLCDLPIDSLGQLPPSPAVPAAAMNVVPGYEGVRLPLAEDEMPISLAWRGDGTMILCSLKGRVCLVRDTDGDGLEDTIQPLSDELAAPYGAAAKEGAIDVIAKYGLLRLYDRDGDGHAERTEVLASGWGYTPDYHDWAVGLEKDRQGNYYIALPCQQDNRSPEAAYLRGQGLKLAVRQPTSDDPHRYAIDPFCGGLRFPMGLAINRDGALFATDNQGNYNPFNELNHLQAGKRYGFINKLEQSPDFKPPLTPPAIDIPHPWTRSVNGIAFLDTPAELRKRLGRDLFGAHEGHLIGCEYDSRQLVRMSLEQVEGVYQGAVYPFTAPTDDKQEPLQGPISCGVSPAGDLVIGNIRDSGWGAGRNVGSLVRLRPTGDLPPGIAEVHAMPDGFTIEFTTPIDRSLAADKSSYAVESYTRVSTPAYGGPDVDRKPATIRHIEVAPDARQVTLTLDALRENYVYEIRTVNLAPASDLFHPSEAHYTLRRVPR
jgi:mono/diheme cytochrome c family protein